MRPSLLLTHPEVCFRALAGMPIIYSKKRMKVLMNDLQLFQNISPKP